LSQGHGFVIAGHHDVDERGQQGLAAKILYTVWIATPASAAIAAIGLPRIRD
jgi:hypothetical protein